MYIYLLSLIYLPHTIIGQINNYEKNIKVNLL